MGARRAAVFGWCGCGGGLTGCRGRAQPCLSDGSGNTTAGPKIRETASITGLFTCPDGATGDRLWRDDRLYDLIIELDHNARPRVAGRGSAVFIHVAREGFKPTAGCVALQAPRLQRLLERVGPKTRIVIQ